MLSFVFFMCLSVLPTFTSAAVVDLLEGKTGVIESTGKEFKNMTDGDKTTYEKVYTKFPIMYDLGEIYTIDKFTINETRGTGAENAASLHVKYYDSNKKVLADFTKFTVTQKVNDVRYVSIEYDYLNPLYVYEFKVYGTSDKVTNITNLEGHSDVNKISFSWKNPDSPKFAGVKIYQGNRYLTTVDKSLNSYVVDKLQPDTSYDFKFTSVDLNGFETVGVSNSFKTLIDPKTVPPSNVTNLKVSDIKSNSVKLSWVNPTDNDLKGLRIFNGNKLISETGIVDSFLVNGLEPKTEYEFKVIAVDNDGNLSGSSTVRFTTLEFTDTEPPKSPEGLAVKQGSEALFLTWKNNTEKDLAGYNVYLDGKKVNSVLVDNPFFTLRDLNNDADYKVQVSAVDKSGNESTLSSVVVGKPVSSGLPIIGTDYSLNDVTLGISEFFGSFWLIIAFAVSIPLSFYIAARVKLLFLD